MVSSIWTAKLDKLTEEGLDKSRRRTVEEEGDDEEGLKSEGRSRDDDDKADDDEASLTSWPSLSVVLAVWFRYDEGRRLGCRTTSLTTTRLTMTMRYPDEVDDEEARCRRGQVDE